jgi:hypothetical protein
MRRKKKSIKFSKKQIYILWSVSVFLVLFFYFTLLRPIQMVTARSSNLKNIANKTFSAAKTQDLTALEKNLKELKSELVETEKGIRIIYIYKHLPLVGYMFSDLENGLEATKHLLNAGEKSVTAIEPYADLIGFKKGSEFSNQPTEKRLETAILTIDKLVPQIDKIDTDLEKAKVYLSKINPNKYPKKIGGKIVRERIIQIYDQVFGMVKLATDAKPLFKKLPYILGKDEERKYLVLFLNDAELRPTGGFITAYAIFSVEKGQIKVKESSDIYDLDSTISHPRAPTEILTYHKGVSTFNIRDSNLSPDYVKSVGYFEDLLEKSSRDLEYDGIISIDTQILVNTLSILGETEAGGVMFKADIDPRCDCPQVIYELENIITRPTPYFREQRKSILSVLLYNLMQKSLGVSPSQYWGSLVQAYLNDLDRKHIQVFFKDKSSQKAIESLGYGGRIEKFDEGDYLHINNTNFAGAKSNMYVKYTVNSETEKKSNVLLRELTLEYRNIYPASDCNLERGGLCLNAPLRNWLRVYVPEGAKLISFVGSEMKVQQYKDLGKQVFEGFITVKPMGKSVVRISYEIPANKIIQKDAYKLFIQKQAGIEEMEISVKYNNQEQLGTQNKDTVYTFKD